MKEANVLFLYVLPDSTASSALNMTPLFLSYEPLAQLRTTDVMSKAYRCESPGAFPFPYETERDEYMEA